MSVETRRKERAGQRPNKTNWRPPILTRLQRPLRSILSTCSTIIQFSSCYSSNVQRIRSNAEPRQADTQVYSARRRGKTFYHSRRRKTKAFVSYVTDICSAICKVIQLGIPGQVYNIGTFFEISVSDVAKAIQMAVNEATGRPPNDNVMLVKEKDRPYNDRRYYMDSSKLRTEKMTSTNT